MRKLSPRVPLMVRRRICRDGAPRTWMRQISFVATLGHQVEQLISAIHRIQPTAVTRVCMKDRARVVLVEHADPRSLAQWKFAVLVVVEDHSLHLLGHE